MKRILKCLTTGLILMFSLSSVQSGSLNISQIPLILTNPIPMTLIVLARDHQLYYEAYDHMTDINGDNNIDTEFTPSITYTGYFDSNKCYSHDSTKFIPISPVMDPILKTCSGAWSGNFLNYLTMTRLDMIRLALYGGKRAIDAPTETVLERSYIPQESHAFGIEYSAASSYLISNYTPLPQPVYPNRHLFLNTSVGNAKIPMLRVLANVNYHIWDWASIRFPAGNTEVSVNPPTRMNLPSGAIADYVVRVSVCNSAIGLEQNCKGYGSLPPIYKPTGILQTYGENGSMLFGLLTGSYANNLNGGVLRKNIESFSNEVDPNTGIFTPVNGIVSTLSKLTMNDFNPTTYQYNCGLIPNRQINNGECEMWGNPIAEMMYEGLRYFSGVTTPTPAFDYTGTSTDTILDLPKVSWASPYNSLNYCSKANMLVISSLNPTYDSDAVPGTFFGNIASPFSSTLNSANIGQTIFSNESLPTTLFIGQSGGNLDYSPTPKAVSSLGNIRGLPYNETGSEGSYYAASIANYGWMNDINSTVQGNQNVKVFVAGITPWIPKITVPINSVNVTIYPVAKTIRNYSPIGIDPINPGQGEFQPTNPAIDVYLESRTVFDNKTTFIYRVYFPNAQQGSDFSAYSTAQYTITVDPVASTVSVSLESLPTWTATSNEITPVNPLVQHIGYAIRGTIQDGLYLDIKNLETQANPPPMGQDIDYFLDTPTPIIMPPLPFYLDNFPLQNTSQPKVFLVTSLSTSDIQSPLWYAAKWGGFNDLNHNQIPDEKLEYDTISPSSATSFTPDNFFSIMNQTQMSTQMEKAAKSILERTSSGTIPALSQTYLNDSPIIYQASFSTSDWTGSLFAFAIDQTTGAILTNGPGPNGSLWDAGAVLNTQNYAIGRSIMTFNGAQGIPFRWPVNQFSPNSSELNLSQIAALLDNQMTSTEGPALLDFIRGDKTNEQSNGAFWQYRNRSSILGDIVNSNPLVVPPPKQTYPTLWPSGSPENASSYTDFKTTYQLRPSMVYVGANDGMLHAINTANGSELFAYIPSPAIKNLRKLSSVNYSHQYYVNAPPTSNDVFVSGQWATYLVGGLGAGGQGIYALDITDPNAHTNEVSANTLVKWEFTDSQDTDLGYTFGQPAIVRLANGKWGVILGNGYNNTDADGLSSSTGFGVLYVLDLETGAIIKKFSTEQGTTDDPLGLGRPNGLSSPAVVDVNGDFIADLVYVGDLFGNLWKIDISSSDPNNWKFSDTTAGGKPAPLFIATDSLGNRQPITSRPAISRLNQNNLTGYQIYFGTGQFFEVNDNTSTSIQSIYGIYDKVTPSASIPINRIDLQEQTIISETNSSDGTPTRIVSNNQVPTNKAGWYIDLIVNNTPLGERVVNDVVYLNGKLIASTLISNSATQPCESGGTSWLMEINALTGARLNYTVFDTNHDNALNSSDLIGGLTVSGIKSSVGIIGSPSILFSAGKEYKYFQGSSGENEVILENAGPMPKARQSWNQLK